MFNLGQLLSHETKERMRSAALKRCDVISKKYMIRVRRGRREKFTKKAA